VELTAAKFFELGKTEPNARRFPADIFFIFLPAFYDQVSEGESGAAADVPFPDITCSGRPRYFVLARSNSSRQLSYLLALFVAVIAIAVLYLAKTVVVPLALAILFTFLLAPLVTLLERIRLPRVLAILLVISTFACALGWIGWTVGKQLVEVTAHLPAYRMNIADKLATFHKSSTKDTSFNRAEKEIQHLGEQLGVSEKNATAGARERERDRLLGSSPDHPVAVREVQPTDRLDTLHGVLGDMVFVLLTLVFTFFMLLQREDLRNRIIRLTGRGHLNLMTQAMDEASQRVSRYFSLQLLVNTCYGAIIFTALHFIGLPHAVLFGVLAGLLRFIPYIGAPIAALLPTLLSMAVFHGWTQTLLIMALFFCMEVLTANFIEPHLYGKQTGLSSLAILVAAVFWTLIWGPIGLILSVPLTVCLVVVGARVPQLEFLKVLLGDEPVMRPEAHYYQRLLAGDEHEAGSVLEGCLKEMSLAKLYDSVVIPALILSEQDRHRNALDDATVDFIDQTTRELVEELGLSNGQNGNGRNGGISHDVAQPDAAETHSAEQANIPAPEPVPPANALCIPVGDNADEIAALMLVQLLERAGNSAQALPLGDLDRTLMEVSKARPDIVYLSAVPPYGMSHARGIYRKLRGQTPQLRIVIGIWKYSGDSVQAARQISRGEQDKLSTSLADAVLQARTPASGTDVPAPNAPAASSNDPIHRLSAESSAV
jgi:predicted PurR-regulated permease PerM